MREEKGESTARGSVVSSIFQLVKMFAAYYRDDKTNAIATR